MVYLDDFARLRILTHSVIVINLMLGHLITRSGGSPMSIKGCPNGLLIHQPPPLEFVIQTYPRLIGGAPTPIAPDDALKAATYNERQAWKCR
jgi:hypothetical protein